MIDEPSSFQCLLVNFSSIFTEPSFRNFMALASGWTLGTGRRTISRVIQVAGLSDERSRHHSIFYRFFSRARWEPSELCKVILSLVLKLIPETHPIILTVDDTLCRKSGAHLWGGGMHHDALLSNYGRGKSLVKFFSFGHNWVIICVCIPMPWNEERWMAVPVAFRLYRSKKRCPKAKYRKRTELAREMLSELDRQIPQEQKDTRPKAPQETRRKSGNSDGPLHSDSVCPGHPLVFGQRILAGRRQEGAPTRTLVSRKEGALFRRHARRAQTSPVD